MRLMKNESCLALTAIFAFKPGVPAVGLTASRQVDRKLTSNMSDKLAIPKFIFNKTPCIKFPNSRNNPELSGKDKLRVGNAEYILSEILNEYKFGEGVNVELLIKRPTL